MKTLAQKLIATGADLSTKKALKNTLNYLGINPDNIDKLYVELNNSIHEDKFKRHSPDSKAVFLPQCLRNSKTCKATLDKHGWKCVKCSGHKDCKVFAIKEKGERLGYNVFIVPGGSLVYNIIKELRPKAVLGVACMKELLMAVEDLKIPTQAVLLRKDGCVDTDVSLKDVFSVLDSC